MENDRGVVLYFNTLFDYYNSKVDPDVKEHIGKTTVEELYAKGYLSENYKKDDPDMTPDGMLLKYHRAFKDMLMAEEKFYYTKDIMCAKAVLLAGREAAAIGCYNAFTPIIFKRMQEMTQKMDLLTKKNESTKKQEVHNYE